MKIVFMGTPEFAVPSLEALVAAGHQVVGVFSQPDKPKNRGMKLQPTPVKLCAMVHDLPVYQPTKLRDGTALETIRSLAPDLIVVAAYGRILPQEILDYPKYGCINVHSSLLPKYRGAAPIHWSILNGDKETGVTIMHMALALDAGDIISQVKTPIDPDETVEMLHDRLPAWARTCWRRPCRTSPTAPPPALPRTRAKSRWPPCSAGSFRPWTGPSPPGHSTTRCGASSPGPLPRQSSTG